MTNNTVSTSLIECIISRNEFIQYKDELDKNCVVISISEPEHSGYDDEELTDEQISGFKDSLRVKFWDIEETIGKYEVIPDDIAEVVRNFILDNKDERFIIHCRAGQSRSAGVGMAVECLINHNGNKYDYSLCGSDISSHPRYSANLTVYDKVVGK